MIPGVVAGSTQGGGPPVAPNPSWANVTLLLHAEGSDGGTTFLDSSSSPKSPSVVAGSTQIDTAQFKFGASSIIFDGSGDYLEYANDAAWEFGVDDFTMECWVRFSAYSESYAGLYGASIFSNYRAGIGGPSGFGFRVNGTASSYETLNLYTGTTDLNFTGPSLALDTWHHVAVSRNSGVVRAFVNGRLHGTPVANSDNFTASQVSTSRPLRIGQLFDATYLFSLNGHLDEIRFSKEGIYTDEFQPPAEQFPDGPSPDPDFANVALLLHLNGPDGGSTFTDSSSFEKTVSRSGTVEIDTAHYKFGGASCVFGGAAYLTSASAMSFGAGDFTVEGWFRFNSTEDMGVLAGASNTEMDFAFIGTQVRIGRLNTAWDSSFNFTRSTDVWYHVAWCRDGTDLRVFVDGTQIGSTATNSLSYDADTSFKVGASADVERRFNGWIDDFRVTVGVARYTSDFTPPAAQFPDF